MDRAHIDRLFEDNEEVYAKHHDDAWAEFMEKKEHALNRLDLSAAAYLEEHPEEPKGEIINRYARLEDQTIAALRRRRDQQLEKERTDFNTRLQKILSLQDAHA